MTLWIRTIAAAIAIVAIGCTGDPSAPAAFRLEVRPDTIRFEALRDTVRPLVLERRGHNGPSPLFLGTYAILDTNVATVSASGVITSRRTGATRFIVRSPLGASDSAVIVVSQSVAQLRPLRDTLALTALDAFVPIDVVAYDPLGSEIEGAAFEYAVADSGIASVTASGFVRARANGLTTVTVTGQEQTNTIFVRVAQRVATIATNADTLHFTALGEERAVVATAMDSLGHPVPDAHYQITIGDTSVLERVDSLRVRSRAYGVSSLRIDVEGVTADRVGLVARTPARIQVTITDTAAIQSVGLDSLLPVTCQVLDGDGAVMAIEPSVRPSDAGRWTGSTCETLRARGSGIDSLQVEAGSVATTVPIAIAVRPMVGAVNPIVVDSLPAQALVWAPTARRNSAGQVELYVAGYSPEVDSAGFNQGNLYRLVSSDGMQFRFDGTVLAHDPSFCDPIGSGIENVDIVPRADGPGWRMFFSGGSFQCYGWQVFSAVSTDERTWTREPGARVSNGGPLPPNPPGGAPYPAGEGMVTDRLPDGSWRMTVGTYEPLTPREDKFQITEWRSDDQLNWTYLRTLLSTRQLPAEGERSVYSPAIREIAPGIWRMFFTADDRDRPDGRSRVWSAVSLDRVSWQVEGAILDQPGIEYFYSTLVDDRLYSVQALQGSMVGDRSLIAATIDMP